MKQFLVCCLLVSCCLPPVWAGEKTGRHERQNAASHTYTGEGNVTVNSDGKVLISFVDDSGDDVSLIVHPEDSDISGLVRVDGVWTIARLLSETARLGRPLPFNPMLLENPISFLNLDGNVSMTYGGSEAHASLHISVTREDGVQFEQSFELIGIPDPLDIVAPATREKKGNGAVQKDETTTCKAVCNNGEITVVCSGRMGCHARCDGPTPVGGCGDKIISTGVWLTVG